jgi:hypothetical protein
MLLFLSVLSILALVSHSDPSDSFLSCYKDNFILLTLASSRIILIPFLSIVNQEHNWGFQVSSGTEEFVAVAEHWYTS